MICKVTYWDGTVTHFAYKFGQLARILDPGNEVTLFGYDSGGNVTQVRDPLQSDWVGTNASRVTIGSRTIVKYAANKAQAIVLASPNGAETNVNTLASEGTISGRPFHRYEYLTNESRVYVNGINPDSAGWDRKVTYNQYAQTLTEADTARAVTEIVHL